MEHYVQECDTETFLQTDVIEMAGNYVKFQHLKGDIQVALTHISKMFASNLVSCEKIQKLMREIFDLAEKKKLITPQNKNYAIVDHDFYEMLSWNIMQAELKRDTDKIEKEDEERRFEASCGSYTDLPEPPGTSQTSVDLELHLRKFVIHQ